MRGLPDKITLHQMLCLLPRDTKVGIWDCRRPYTPDKVERGYEKHPNKQSYCKIENLNYAKIQWLLTEEVSSAVPVGDNMILIQIRRARDEFYIEYDNEKLARKIAEEIKRTTR